MRVAIPKEVRLGERRVAGTPQTVSRLIKLGFDVVVEAGAGAASSFRDEEYESAGAKIETDVQLVWGGADLVLKVQPPELHPLLKVHEAELLPERAVLISFLWPGKNKELVQRLAERKATVLAMDQIPRISRAQKVDALSSMANIAGYRAVVEAASFYGRFFTGQMTAAGKVPPAKVFVIGAGVAGLAAIGAARGLGAVVRAFDTRSAVKEQVQSMGAEFVELNVHEEGEGSGGYAKEMSKEYITAEMELVRKQVTDCDIIITTALVPDRPAPVLITAEMVDAMRAGSVIVDLAAETGGNCALTRPGEVVVHQGVTIIGYIDLPSRLAPTASQMYGSNLAHLLADMGGAKSWHVDLDDAVVRGAMVLHEGELKWPPPKLQPVTPPPTEVKPAPPRLSGVAAATQAVSAKHVVKDARTSGTRTAIAGTALSVGLLALGAVAPPEFLSHLTIFVLACFVGWQVIWKVTPALHTPLMSVTNAISGIILIGGMLQIAGPVASPVVLLGAAAALLATINVAGGFLVTQRMLRMFHK